MPIGDVLLNRQSRWLTGSGAGDVAVSARVRLARNLTGLPFPTRLGGEELERLVAMVEEALPAVQRAFADLELHRLESLNALQRQALQERHLVSPAFAEAGRGALLLRQDESLCAMVPEEDHLRLQGMAPGLRLDEAWQAVSTLDGLLGEHLDYAFSPRWGFLTTCPTNTGTGLRASVMLHLPGLVMTRQAGPLFEALAKVGVAVRGLYGEGTEAQGNLFQISNQVTLGVAEEGILQSLRGICQQVVDSERSARERLRRELGARLEDRVWRAYGVLTTARVMTSREALALVSDLRLGIDLGIVTNMEARTCNELWLAVTPALLQVAEGRLLGPEERDVARANMIRRRLAEAAAGGAGRRGG